MNILDTGMRISNPAGLRFSLALPLFTPKKVPELNLYHEAAQLAQKIRQRGEEPEKLLTTGQLYAIALLRRIQLRIITAFCRTTNPDLFEQVYTSLQPIGISTIIEEFERAFPWEKPEEMDGQSEEAMHIRDLFLLQVTRDNPAVMKATPSFFSDPVFIASKDFKQGIAAILKEVEEETKPSSKTRENNYLEDLYNFLMQPVRANPDNLSAQLAFIRGNWSTFVGDLLEPLLRAEDFLKEEQRPVFPPGPGPVQTLDFSLMNQEYEAFSQDSNWMPNVILMAKSTLVWLDQLSKQYKRSITRLDQIPDEELDLLASRGFNALWLIGLWERCPASKKIKHLCGNPEAESSAYSLKGYRISPDIGGNEALQNLKDRCQARHIRLASDMVPNHTGLDSWWMKEHPGYFLQTDTIPYPNYTFQGMNLSSDPDLGIFLEDHYFDQSDAAVAFKRIDYRTNEVRYIYHGNDGTTMPWNDTAQLDYLNPETREAVIQTIIQVAKDFPIIRFDAAMTLARKHIQRLWYPAPGQGGDIPGRSAYGLSEEEFLRAIPQEFWREVVDRIAEEAPDTLLLAEAFWMMEGYFVRTLGMHRVYNSAFMNMVKNEENGKYRDTIKSTLAFDPEILKRFVNFMNNPDEDTAIEQFGDGDKYFGVCTLLVTLPGLPMFGHGQIEGFREKYGMEYAKSYWNEKPDQALIGEHYRRIFPLLRKRYLFSEAEHFALYDLHSTHGIQENVYAYTNRAGGERALVFYNNAYAEASGWIQRSAPSMHRISEEEKLAQSTTIGEALGLHNNPDNFCICTGFHDGLIYVRPSSDICSHGLYVKLSGYETQIFMNIYEVTDTDGSYKKLSEQLNGAGTHDLLRALTRIRLTPIHQAAEIFQTPQLIQNIDAYIRGEASDLSKVRSAIQEKLSSLEEAWNATDLSQLPQLPKKFPVHADSIVNNCIDTIEKFFTYTCREEERSYITNTAKVLSELPVILSAWLFTKPLIEDLQPSERPMLTKELLFDEWYRDAMRNCGVPYDESAKAIEAVTCLLNLEGWYSRALASGIEPRNMLNNLASKQEFLTYIRANWHEGIHYYHKESFQSAIFLLLFSERAAEGCPDKEQDKPDPLFELLKNWLKKELYARYQLDSILQ